MFESKYHIGNVPRKILTYCRWCDKQTVHELDQAYDDHAYFACITCGHLRHIYYFRLEEIAIPLEEGG